MQIRRPWVVAMPLAMFFVACATSAWPPLDRRTLPSSRDFPDDDAVVLEDLDRVTFRPGAQGPMATVLRRRRVLVLNPDGSSTASLYGGYSRSFHRLVAVEARVTRPDGSTETFGADDINDHPSYGGSILYDDYRRLHKSFGVLPPGTVVDWKVITEDREPTWRQYRGMFGSRVSSRKETFEVVMPADWEIDYRATQAWKTIEFEPEVRKTESGRKVYAWTKTDLTRIEKEPSGPSYLDVVPLISARLSKWRVGDEVRTGFTDQEDYARWMLDVQKDTDTRNSELERLTLDIVAEAGPNPHDKARALYEWVQANVRYVAIEIGMGGWRPHTALEVFEHRYGDCKDKANLLRTMLRIADIDSHMASIYSHSGLPRPFGLPGVGNSNHAILAVDLPGGLVLADPTSRVVPFGALPSNDQGADVLVIHPERPRVIRTAWSRPEDNVKRLDIRLSLDGGVTASGEANIETTGTFDWSLRRAIVRSAEASKSKLFKDWSWLEGVDVEGETFDMSESAVTGSAKVKVPRIGTAAGDRLLVRASDFLRTPGRSLRRTDRTQPVVFGSPLVRETVVRIALGERTPGDLPSPTELSTDFGRYRQDWSIDDGDLVLRSRFERTVTLVAPDRYDRLVDFLEQIVAARGQSVVLRAGGAG